jgi:nicotinamide phosphoribosyltransferase
MTLLRHREYGSYRTVPLPGDAVSLPVDAIEPGWEEVMQTVWENGELKREWSFAEVREKAAAGR